MHREIYDLLQSGQNVDSIVIAAPRGFAKSTIIALIYVLWVALTRRKRYILLISDSSDQAELLLSHIKAEIEENDIIRDDYGVLEGQKWSESDIYLANGARIMAKGAGKKIRGVRKRQARPDLVIVDDLENDKNILSKSYRDYVKSWFDQAVENVLDPQKGQIIVVGNVLHRFSLVKQKLDSEDWESRFFTCFDKDGNSAWPERFSNEWLETKRRKIGPHAFAREYLNDPVDDDTKVFKDEWLRYYDDLEYLPTDDEGLPVMLQVRGAIDPAISTENTADWFVFVTVGRDYETGILYLLDIYRGRATYKEHAQEVLKVYKRWNHEQITIETTAFQEILQPIFADIGAKQGLYPPFNGVKPQKNKEMRIQKLQAPFENGLIYIRKDMRNKNVLLDEYDLYPGTEHDDVLDALEMTVDSYKGGFVMDVD